MANKLVSVAIYFLDQDNYIASLFIAWPVGYFFFGAGNVGYSCKLLFPKWMARISWYPSLIGHFAILLLIQYFHCKFVPIYKLFSLLSPWSHTWTAGSSLHTAAYTKLSVHVLTSQVFDCSSLICSVSFLSFTSPTVYMRTVFFSLTIQCIYLY